MRLLIQSVISVKLAIYWLRTGNCESFRSIWIGDWKTVAREFESMAAREIRMCGFEYVNYSSSKIVPCKYCMRPRQSKMRPGWIIFLFRLLVRHLFQKCTATRKDEDRGGLWRMPGPGGKWELVDAVRLTVTLRAADDVARVQVNAHARFKR